MRIFVGAHCFLGAVIAIALIASPSHATELSDVLRNPAAYDHREVALTGVARVEGASFVLYEDVTAASKLDGSKGIYVKQQRNGQDYDRFDRQWVRVTGIVDGAKQSISVKDVKPVPNRLRPEIRDITTYGVFENKTGTEIRLTLRTNTGATYQEFSIGRNGSNKGAIYEGTAIATNTSGAEVARGTITPPQLTLDQQCLPRGSQKRVTYYRIRPGRIETVAR